MHEALQDSGGRGYTEKDKNSSDFKRADYLVGEIKNTNHSPRWDQTQELKLTVHLIPPIY